MLRILVISLLGFFIGLHNAYAILTIEITGGREGGQPIAIVPFSITGGAVRPTEEVATIISNDLARTGRFSPVPVANLPAQPSSESQVSFATWQGAGIPHLVIGRISTGTVGGYVIEFQLFDTLKGTQLLGLSYPANSKTLRQVAHQISDAIYKALTGQRGVAGTRIVYVTVQKHSGKKIYRLFVADADGANPKKMLESIEPILSPKWSPDGKKIAYVSLEGKQSAIYLQDVRTGQRERISAQPGLNSAPAWSPDGTRLALTLSKDGNAEIYVLDLRTRALTRLTNHPAIDTEPTWSPDGKTIAFTSDRSGAPQIYRMSANGGETQRITFNGNYNASARFSPDGDLMVLLHGGESGYQISTLNLKDGQLNAISQTTMDDSPSFAPNGSMVIYGTGKELAASSVDGIVKQRLVVDTGEEVKEPAWSPFND